jgi:tetratricopeptide (TPR) repeat protein
MSEEAPFGYEANLERGRLLRQSGRPLEACRYFGDAIQADPRQPRAYLELALAQLDLPDGPNQAHRTIDRALALAPDSALYLGYKAFFLFRLGRKEEAVELSARALEIDPSSYIALFTKAHSHDGLCQWEQAEKVARRMLELNAEDGTALNLLACALRNQNRLTEAQAVTSQLLARFPNDPFGQVNAGYDALKKDRNREATGHFLNALQADPFLDDARVGLLQSIRARLLPYRMGCKFVEVLKKEMSMAETFLFLISILFTAGLYIIVLFVAFEPVCNLLLLLNPVARRALNRREKGLALFTGLLAAIFLLALVVTGQSVGAFLLVEYGLFLIGCVYIPQLEDAVDRWKVGSRK